MFSENAGTLTLVIGPYSRSLLHCLHQGRKRRTFIWEPAHGRADQQRDRIATALGRGNSVMVVHQDWPMPQELDQLLTDMPGRHRLVATDWTPLSGGESHQCSAAAALEMDKERWGAVYLLCGLLPIRPDGWGPTIVRDRLGEHLPELVLPDSTPMRLEEYLAHPGIQPPLTLAIDQGQPEPELVTLGGHVGGFYLFTGQEGFGRIPRRPSVPGFASLIQVRWWVAES